ncbi:MAG TPA: hypothetical protein VM848_14955 [Acidimicrobiia bacterium]|nr:hypothetical protein [Acidimicrobiia bacterium]
MTASPENVAVTPRKAPGRKWYLLAGLLALAGLLGAGFALWQTLTTIDDDLQRADFPGQNEFVLAEPGTYTIFVEYPVGSGLDPAVGALAVEVITGQGESLDLNNPNGTFTYTLGGRTGEAVLVFDVEEAGPVLMIGDYPGGESGPDVTLAVSQGLGGRLFAGIGAVIFIPLLTWSAAAAIVVVTFLKRRGARPTSQV